ncbi:MAG: HAD family hydrolase [Syntrophomonadaceae bacterium]|jgi:phosphoglycolate phosphatase
MQYMVKVIMFDFDGVIIDSGNDIAYAFQHVLKQFNQPVLTRDEIVSYVGRGVEYLVRSGFKNCSEEMLKEVLPIYRKQYLDNAVIDTTLYKNVQATLENIKNHLQDKKIALVTNKPENLTRKILDILGIDKYFDLVVCPESVKNIKPDPEGIKKVLQEFNIPARQAIMVGDSDIDIEAGKKAGTYTCGVTYGMGNKQDLIQASPDFFINDISDLLKYIK